MRASAYIAPRLLEHCVKARGRTAAGQIGATAAVPMESFRAAEGATSVVERTKTMSFDVGIMDPYAAEALLNQLVISLVAKVGASIEVGYTLPMHRPPHMVGFETTSNSTGGGASLPSSPCSSSEPSPSFFWSST